MLALVLILVVAPDVDFVSGMIASSAEANNYRKKAYADDLIFSYNNICDFCCMY